ncbi:MAG: xanthine dehydrogenase family protein subunit M, partial [Deltaproteobacteria bacterium]|nr:xanthine dehydrogenase family protein subunit M [Deltaproteobacteria bacterium]
PIIVKEAENAVKGRVPSPEMANLAAEAASKAVQGVIVPNASTSKEYRVKMAGVVARRAVKEALNL